MRWAIPGRNWLFFGDQHRTEHFYYRDDLEDMVRDGLLNRFDLAFSRDQPDRVYVQHKMTRLRRRRVALAARTVPTSTCAVTPSRMAKDVDDALTRSSAPTVECPSGAAHDYKRELVATKRYVRDVY